MREETLNAVVTIAPKLKASVVNGDFIKQITKMQLDSHDTVRSAATNSLAKVAPLLESSVVKKFLLAGYCRALHDANHTCRLAAISGLLGTIQMYPPEDLANQLVPQIFPLLLDSSR